ncbi:MAG TPA: phospholipase D-like domain-containing protein [Gemmatimonadales bacterium]|nr:phospholipase D-like domain-containing protein [Gemmatimonadales bacterium]
MSTGRAVLRTVATVLITLLGVMVLRNLTSGERQVERVIPRHYPVHSPDFMRAMGIALGPSAVGGNRIETLLNGDAIFPSMLQGIRSARRTITFETFIYWSGEIGRLFAEALAERARGGVKVHVLVDWVGSKRMDTAHIGTMTAAGVEFRKYRPLRWYNLNRLNNRTHRKLLVVDGRIGYTGGVGIADMWTGNGEDPEHWRDSHFRLEGPVVAQMQAAFLDNWVETSGAVLHGSDYFPGLEPAGTDSAQLFISSASGGGDSMALMYLLAITAAQRSIDLSSAYFVPDDLALKALTDARARGVRVRIITPGRHMDVETVRRASRARWGALLSAGAEIHEYQPTMYHCKVFIVDGLLVSVGSANFDTRSFHLDDEASLNIYDAEFARQATEVFERDLTRARKISLAEWEQRPLREKIMERLASLLRTQL